MKLVRITDELWLNAEDIVAVRVAPGDRHNMAEDWQRDGVFISLRHVGTVRVVDITVDAVIRAVRNAGPSGGSL